MPDAPTKGTILTRGLYDPKIKAEMEAAARKWRTRRLSDLDRIEGFCRSLDWIDADAAYAQGRELTEREERAALARYAILIEAPYAREFIERDAASPSARRLFERIRQFYDDLVMDLGPELNLGLKQRRPRPEAWAGRTRQGERHKKEIQRWIDDARREVARTHTAKALRELSSDKSYYDLVILELNKRDHKQKNGKPVRWYPKKIRGYHCPSPRRP